MKSLFKRTLSFLIAVLMICTFTIGTFATAGSCVGYQITVAYSSGVTKAVKIHPRKTGTHSFRIMTTGYSDTITRVR